MGSDCSIISDFHPVLRAARCESCQRPRITLSLIHFSRTYKKSYCQTGAFDIECSLLFNGGPTRNVGMSVPNLPMSPANLTNTLDHLNLSNVVGLFVRHVKTSIRNPFGLALFKRALFSGLIGKHHYQQPRHYCHSKTSELAQCAGGCLLILKRALSLLPCVSFVPGLVQASVIDSLAWTEPLPRAINLPFLFTAAGLFRYRTFM